MSIFSKFLHSRRWAMSLCAHDKLLRTVLSAWPIRELLRQVIILKARYFTSLSILLTVTLGLAQFGPLSAADAVAAGPASSAPSSLRPSSLSTEQELFDSLHKKALPPRGFNVNALQVSKVRELLQMWPRTKPMRVR